MTQDPLVRVRQWVRRIVGWTLAALALAIGLCAAFGADPDVTALDMDEAVLSNDYAVVVTFVVYNCGGPGFCTLQVNLTYADQGTWTRKLRMFLWPGETRRCEVIFREPQYLAGVLTGVLQVLSGDFLSAAESLQARVVVERTWPPTFRSNQ